MFSLSSLLSASKEMLLGSDISLAQFCCFLENIIFLQAHQSCDPVSSQEERGVTERGLNVTLRHTPLQPPFL